MSAADNEKQGPRRVPEALLDKALGLQRPVVLNHLRRARGRRPEALPGDIIGALEKAYLASMTGTGAAVGGAAAAPGVGTGTAIALSAGETLGFLEASLLLSLAVAEVHGVPFEDVEHRRTLLFAILLGNSGSSFVEKMAGRTGAHWGRQFTKNVPLETINQINKVLGRWFVTKYGTRQGIIVIGRVAPFGFGAAIGGAGNFLMARTVVAGSRTAFGEAPTEWPPHLELPDH